jgi:hypothetical protein
MGLLASASIAVCFPHDSATRIRYTVTGDLREVPVADLKSKKIVPMRPNRLK